MLPLWNRNRGGIAVERATRSALHAEYDARLAQTRAEIAAALEGIRVARRQRDAAIQALPATRRFAEASARAAARGDIAIHRADHGAGGARPRNAGHAGAAGDRISALMGLTMVIGMVGELVIFFLAELPTAAPIGVARAGGEAHPPDRHER